VLCRHHLGVAHEAFKTAAYVPLIHSIAFGKVRLLVKLKLQPVHVGGFTTQRLPINLITSRRRYPPAGARLPLLVLRLAVLLQLGDAWLAVAQWPGGASR
jgi:hypothetical protein